MKKAARIIMCVCMLVCFMAIIAQAANISLNSKQAYQIAHSGDVMEYTFTTTKNDSFYRITLKNLSVNDHIIVKVFDKYDAEIIYWDYWQYISKGKEKYTDIKLEKGEKYTIKAWANGGQEKGYVEVSINELIDAVPDKKETATKIAYSATTIREITAGNDCDYFKFTTTTNDSYYRITLKNQSVNDHLLIKVYDKYDAEIIYWDYWQYISKGKEKYTDIKLEKGEEYHLAIWANGGVETGNYSLSITEIIDDVPDSKETATKLSNNVQYVATIDAGSDRDFYQVVASSGKLTLTLDNSSINDHLIMIVYDKYDSEIVNWDYWQYISKGKSKNVELNVTSGETYWINIRANGGIETGDYKLTIGNAAKTVEIKPQDNSKISVTIPTFAITINGTKVNNTNAKYPYIVYNDITYFPTTYHGARFLGLQTNWTKDTGLVISKLAGGKVGNGDTATQTAQNKGSYSAVKATGLITVNGKSIDNASEPYPLIVFRDVTYFPLTWRFAVTEFGWDYNFTAKSGLVINSK